MQNIDIMQASYKVLFSANLSLSAFYDIKTSEIFHKEVLLLRLYWNIGLSEVSVKCVKKCLVFE